MKALIDTGAPRTVFPRGIGDLLCVEFPSYSWECDKKIQLMGHEWGAVSAVINLSLRPFDDVFWDAEVDFVLDEGLPYGLLGYEGFLNRWAVTVNGYLGYVVIEQADDAHAREHPTLFTNLRKQWPGL